MSAVRLGDSCSGHGAYPPRSSTSGSPNVMVNGRPAVRLNDSWSTHCDDSDPPNCHGGSSASGSSTVFVNGLPKCRVGDRVSCGSTMAEGSDNVMVG